MNTRALGAVLLALPATAAGITILGGRTVRASANSAPAYWAGVNGSGVVVAEGQFSDGDCPIEVAREDLTLKISQLPDPVSGDLGESSVTASYTFYNPTDDAVVMTLFFPVGYAPQYLTDIPAEEAYAITLDGAAVSRRQRHTYHKDRIYGGTFSVGDELPCDERRTDAFFRESTPVTQYTYEVAAADETRYFTFTFEGNPSRSKVYIASDSEFDIRDGRGELYARVPSGEAQQIVLYVVGDPLDRYEAGVYASPGAFGGQPDGEILSAPEIERTTFGALARALYDPACDVGEIDWYNAFVAMLSDTAQAGSMRSEDLSDYLMLWYEYDVTIPAHASVVNTVTAPLFPTIYGSSQPRYYFEYLLSPAQHWAGFGEIAIRVETPYYLTDSSLQFTAVDDAYTFERNGLPMGELTFTITEHEILNVPFSPYDVVGPVLRTALILLVLSVLGSAVFCIVFLSVRSRRKKLAARRVQNGQGSAEEGKIDFDEFPGGPQDPPAEGGR